MTNKKYKRFSTCTSTHNMNTAATNVNVNVSSCVPVDTTSNEFELLIAEYYTKYINEIKRNRKLYGPSVDKMTWRLRTLVSTMSIDQLPVSNNVYVDLPPVFRIFGLLLPYLSRITMVDMFGMYEQLANISESKPLTDNEIKLIKMSIMNDVKILDLNNMPLTYEQQLNVLVFMNIFLHVVIDSLYQINKEYIPKMIERSLLIHFDNIIETKFKLPCIYDKLNDNDPYHVKVIRKTMLAFGIRPVKLQLKNLPASYNGGLFSGPTTSISMASGTDDADIEEFVDSITVPYDKLGTSEYLETEDGVDYLSLTKFLEKHTKMITVDNKIYWAKFKRAYGILPIFIGRRDVYKKKEYEQLLVANVECCETRFNTRRIHRKFLYCDTVATQNAPSISGVDFGVIKIGGIPYFPLVLMGVMDPNAEYRSEYALVHPFSIFSDESFEPEYVKQCKERACMGIHELLKKLDEHFFCAYKKDTDIECGENNSSFTNIVSEADNVCTDTKVFRDFKELMMQANFGLLYLSNKTCQSPILIDYSDTGTQATSKLSIGSVQYTVVTRNRIECIIESCTHTVFCIGPVDC